MRKFVIKSQINGDLMFNLMSGSNIILTSEGYENKSGCRKGIESVRENSQIDDRYERKRSKDGLWYFVLRAKQGEPIGRSETYDSAFSMNLGISAVKAIAPNAEIEDRGIEFED